MRILSIAAVTLLGSGLSVATAQQHELLGNTKPPTQKQKEHSDLQRSTTTTKVASQAQLLGTPAAPGNQSVVSGGSDNCSTATAIAGPGPFVGDNIGATTDGPSNCGSMAADVWYNYTAGATGLHAFVMCGSGYDTVINVYATAACTGASLGCNDDSCGLQSTLSVALTSGLVYKVQIGGFVGGQGTYTLSVTPPGPGCPCAGAPPEGEGPPCGIPIDSFNGGCNSTPFVYSAIAVGGTVCGTGAFDGATRDTDWYQFTLVAPTTVTWTVTAEFPTLIAILSNVCPPTLIDFDFGTTCTPVSSTAALAAGTYVLFVANDFSTIVPCAGPGNSYNGALTGAGAGITFCEPGLNGVIPCPCGNPPSSPGRGCNNSSNTGGATLSDTGVASLSADTLVFTTTGEKPTALSIVLQGNAVIVSGVPYGDGIRCVSGALKRLYVKSAVGGSITAPQGGDPSVSARSLALGDPISAGQLRYYMVYYRDPFVYACPPSPGTATFNTSSSRQVIWQF